MRFDGNQLARVPTEVLAGPEALQNLQLQDNIIGEKRETERERQTEGGGRGRRMAAAAAKDLGEN